MKRMLLCILGLALLAGSPAGGEEPTSSDQGCRSCHPAMPTPMPPPGKGKPLSCPACHQGLGLARDKERGHTALIANPSTLDQAPRACGPCHNPWPQRVAASPMASAAGIIAQTRYLWGAQADPQPRFGVRDGPGLLALPQPGQSREAVDDFLRRRCLRCHLWSAGGDLAGARRSAGCAACHRPRDEAGKPRSSGHGLTRQVPVSQCLTCHAGCGAGAEYTGRIPRDARRGARFLAANPWQTQLWQGRDWRPMQPDLHFKAGLACQDCHPRPEIMGDGRQRPAALLAVGVRCTTCHGRPGRPAKEAKSLWGAPLTHVKPGPQGLVLTGKLDGKPRPIPALAGGAQAPVAHQVPQHDKVACHACHSASNPAAWGLQVLLETRPGFRGWRELAAQGDPQVLALLASPEPQPPAQAMPPASRDYLSGELRPGLWLLSPFWRRFEWRVYGLGPGERTFLLAPRFQYVVTSPDPQGRLSVAVIPRTASGRPGLGMAPWHSHTTQKATLGCAGCHGRARALGLGLTFVLPDTPAAPGSAAQSPAAPRLAPGLWRPGSEGLELAGDWTRVVDLEGNPTQRFPVPGSGPYTKEQLRSLLQPGKDYTRWLLKAHAEEWTPNRPAPNQAPPARRD